MTPSTLVPAGSAMEAGTPFWLAVAQHWGMAPLPALLLWLGVAAALAAPLAWRLQRSTPSQYPPPVLPGTATRIWMLLAAGLWGTLAWQVTHAGAITRFDSALAQQLGLHAQPALLRLWGTISHLADRPVQWGAGALGAALLLWRRQPALAAGWVCAVAGNGMLNTLLKDWIGRVRPEHVEGFTVAGGFSFPSGHSSGSLVIYGMLTWLLLHRQRHWPRTARTGLIVLAVLVVAAVGYSRIGLQVHYFSDVLGGWLSGSIWLLVSITLARALEQRRTRL